MLLKKNNVGDIDNMEEMSEGVTQNITDEEEKALKGLYTNANSEKVQSALGLISRTFNIGSDYFVTGFKDAGSTVTVSLANAEYEVQVKIKNADKLM